MAAGDRGLLALLWSLLRALVCSGAAEITQANRSTSYPHCQKGSNRDARADCYDSGYPRTGAYNCTFARLNSRAYSYAIAITCPHLGPVANACSFSPLSTADSTPSAVPTAPANPYC